MKTAFKIFSLLFFSQLIAWSVSAACYCGVGTPDNGAAATDCKACISLAANCKWDGQSTCPDSNSSGQTATVKLDNPLPNITSPQKLIGQIINTALGLVGSLALIMFIYGGFIWMTAAGSSEKVSKGKQVLLWAIIGLILIFSSYSLVNFVIFTGLKGK